MALLRQLVFRQLTSKLKSSFSVFYNPVTKSGVHNSDLLVQSRKWSITSQQLSQKEYKVTFVKNSGEKITAKGKEGDSLLDVIVNNNLDFDGFGACEGTLTCSTCHVILKQEDYDRLPEKPSDEELDMLDLAYDLTDTSRLGCQVQLSKDLDGLEVRVPATVNDARSS